MNGQEKSIAEAFCNLVVEALKDTVTDDVSLKDALEKRLKNDLIFQMGRQQGIMDVIEIVHRMKSEGEEG